MLTTSPSILGTLHDTEEDFEESISELTEDILEQLRSYILQSEGPFDIPVGLKKRTSENMQQPDPILDSTVGVIVPARHILRHSVRE